MGLRKLKHLGLKDCEVEGDLAVIVSWGKGESVGSWCLASTIYKIRELMSLLVVSLSHVDGSQNELADKQINWGVSSVVVFFGELYS